MWEATNGDIGENSPEEVAWKLMRWIAQEEKANKDRKWDLWTLTPNVWIRLWASVTGAARNRKGF
jgi:hypothetical protein